MAPTKQIMKIGMKSYEWHELFPKGRFSTLCAWRSSNFNTTDVSSLIKKFSPVAVKSNAGAIVAVWAPIIVVSFDYNVCNSTYDGQPLEV